VCAFVVFGVASDELGSTKGSPRLTLSAMPTLSLGQSEEDVMIDPDAASWINATSNLIQNCDNSGQTDATRCLQRLINHLSSSQPVLYLPCGTYLISSTLSFVFGRTQQYITMIGGGTPGSGALCTTILWSRSAGAQPMVSFDENFGRFDRIILNGQQTASIAMNLPGSKGGQIEDGNELLDDVFENSAIGLGCGTLANGCANVSSIRNHFLNNSSFGIFMGNGNAIYVYNWYSIFNNNNVAFGGTGNGGGNVSFLSFYENNNADMSFASYVPELAYGNYSTNSGSFFNTAGQQSGPTQFFGLKNYIVNETSATPIWSSADQIGTLLENTFVAPSGQNRPLVSFPDGLWRGGSGVLSMYNKFNVGSGTGNGTCTSSKYPVYSGADCYEFDDSLNALAPLSVPEMPGPAPVSNKSIIEERATCNLHGGSDCAADIQNAVNIAAARCSSACGIVHVQAGEYLISRTIKIPAGSAIEIIGDGLAVTTLTSSGASPVLTCGSDGLSDVCEGVVISNVGVHNKSGTAVLISGVDDNSQFGQGRVLLISPSINSDTIGVKVNGVNSAVVEFHSGIYYSDGNFLNVKGGSQGASGTGSVNVFGADSCCTTSGMYVSSGGAHVNIWSAWYDGGKAPIISATGNGSVSYIASQLCPNDGANGRQAIQFRNFTGTAVVANNFMGYAGGYTWNTSGVNTKAKLLWLQNVGPQASTLVASGVGEVDENIQFYSWNGGSWKWEGDSTTPNESFLVSTLGNISKVTPEQQTSLPVGVTDVTLYRVDLSNSATGLDIEP
jgi:hypothetical protein